MTLPSPEDDPPPTAPVMPDLDNCCGQGCDPCVFDVFEAARQRHLAALQAWQARQEERRRQAQPPRDDAC